MILHTIHGFKNPSYAKAIILSESNLDTESCDGRTGKGLIVKAIKELKTVTTINAKRIDFSDRFVFQSDI